MILCVTLKINKQINKTNKIMTQRDLYYIIQVFAPDLRRVKVLSRKKIPNSHEQLLLIRLEHKEEEDYEMSIITNIWNEVFVLKDRSVKNSDVNIYNVGHFAWVNYETQREVLMPITRKYPII